jgi:PAS domain-containing protein
MTSPKTAEVPEQLDTRARAAILDCIPTALLVADSSGSVSYANQRAAALLGSGPAPLAGRPVSRVLAPLERLRELSDVAAEDDGRPSISIQRDGADPQEIGIQLRDIDVDATPDPPTRASCWESSRATRSRSALAAWSRTWQRS